MTRNIKRTLTGTNILHGDNEPAFISYGKDNVELWSSWYWKGKICHTLQEYIEESGKGTDEIVYIKLAYPDFANAC